MISSPPVHTPEWWLIRKIDNSDFDFLSQIGSDTTGLSALVKFPLPGESSKNTWKQSRNAPRSIDEGFFAWLNPTFYIYAKNRRNPRIRASPD